MTDKPEIKAGQRWRTRNGDVVRVIATDGRAPDFSVIVEDEAGLLCKLTKFGGGSTAEYCATDDDLISLAPSTVKREVALYRYNGAEVQAMDFDDPVPGHETGWRRISAPLTIEFVLLPGETA